MFSPDGQRCSADADADADASACVPVLTASPTAGVPMLPSESPGAAGKCPGQTWPPYGASDSVAGISVGAIARGHTRITNASHQTYYYRASHWPTAQLVCGRGRYEQGGQTGPIAAGKNVDIGEGSTPDVPMSVEIWDRPCGEGCDRQPIGAYVVPVSSVEPVPIRT